MPAIIVRGLHKSYGSLHALRGVDLTVEEGEIMGFLGPNGAGKTTTIRCLMDFIRPERGAIQLFDRDPAEAGPGIRTRIGYLSPEQGLYDHWSGQDHLRLLVRDTKEGESLAKRLDLDLGRRLKGLSTGNKQKLRFVMALIRRPDLLILDEATTGLDPLLQNEIHALLTEFRAGGGTVLLSSHNLPEVERICDRVAIIKEGKVIEEEEMSSLREKQVHHVTLYLKEPIQRKEFQLSGVEITSELQGGYLLRVTGNLTPLLRRLGSLPIKDLEISHASLEEIFLAFYDGKQR